MRLELSSNSKITSANIGFGRGWKTNLNQFIMPWNTSDNWGCPFSFITNNTLRERMPTLAFVYIDHMGVEHILLRCRLASNREDEEIRSLSGHLTYNETDFTLSDRNGNILVFQSVSGSNVRRLNLIRDCSNNSMTINYAANNSFRIVSVSDGAGRTAAFLPNTTGITSSITCAGRSVVFNYNNANLHSIAYSDTSTEATRSEFRYNASWRMVSARDITGHRIEYVHDGHHRVSRIRENTNIDEIADNTTTPVSPNNDSPNVETRPDIVFDYQLHNNLNRTTVWKASDTTKRLRYTYNSMGSIMLIERVNSPQDHSGIALLNVAWMQTIILLP